MRHTYNTLARGGTWHRQGGACRVDVGLVGEVLALRLPIRRLDTTAPLGKSPAPLPGFLQ